MENNVPITLSKLNIYFKHNQFSYLFCSNVRRLNLVFILTSHIGNTNSKQQELLFNAKSCTVMKNHESHQKNETHD